MKRSALVLVLVVMVVGLVHLPASALVNGGFEDVFNGGGHQMFLHGHLLRLFRNMTVMVH